MRCEERSPVSLCCLLCFDLLCEVFEGRDPGTRTIEHVAELFGSFAVPLELAVGELDQRGAFVFGGESDLKLARLIDVHVGDPVGTVVAWADVPGETDAARRFPLKDGAP